MTVACIIPARYNSTRFPGKLLERAGGKTVLQRTFENARRCTQFDSLFISTDDERIAEHSKQIGAEVLWTSSAPRDGTERAIEAMGLYTPIKSASYVMVLQGDHPCTSPATIGAIVDALVKNNDAVLSTAAAPILSLDDFLSPQIVKCVFDTNKNALYFSRSPIPHTKREMPLNAYAHIGIYCYRRTFLEHLSSLKPTPLQEIEDLEQLKVLELGYKIKVAIANEKTPSVDTPEDLVKLEEYLWKQNTFS